MTLITLAIRLFVTVATLHYLNRFPFEIERVPDKVHSKERPETG